MSHRTKATIDAPLPVCRAGAPPAGQLTSLRPDAPRTSAEPARRPRRQNLGGERVAPRKLAALGELGGHYAGPVTPLEALLPPGLTARLALIDDPAAEPTGLDANILPS